MKRSMVLLGVLFGGYFSVSAEHFYVSRSGSHSSPYTNGVTAATNIQDAVDAATAGDTVLVTNGVYSLGGNSYSRVYIPQAITVQSVNGVGVTVIDGGGFHASGAKRRTVLPRTNPYRQHKAC